MSSLEEMRDGVERTPAEFRLPLFTGDAASAFGRYAALEYASALDVRDARRALAKERGPLLRRCGAVGPIGRFAPRSGPGR